LKINNLEDNHTEPVPEKVQVYDFIYKNLDKVTPYGVYDPSTNEGWVSVGTEHNTAGFAVESIRHG
jgi:hypothetical protein